MQLYPQLPLFALLHDCLHLKMLYHCIRNRWIMCCRFLVNIRYSNVPIKKGEPCNCQKEPRIQNIGGTARPKFPYLSEFRSLPGGQRTLGAN